VKTLLAAALVAAFLAGCGSSGDDKAKTSMADAQRDFVIACRQGGADELDAQLCRCIAAEAVKRPEYDTPQELATLADQQRGTDLPKPLARIVEHCATKLAGAG
jgi:hypothetical protein